MFLIKIADVIIGIKNKYEWIHKQCTDYIVKNGTPEFMVSATEQELFQEQQCADRPYAKGYLESICVYRKICSQLPKYNAFLLHSSVIEIDGAAYAFSAKSGVGKTTHTKLWMNLLENRAVVINGDKPIYRLNKGEFYAYGTPWAGKENWNKNANAVLKGICCLKQSLINEMYSIPSCDAVDELYSQILIPFEKENALKMLELLDLLVKTVPVYILKCNITQQAAELSYSTMTKEKCNED